MVDNISWPLLIALAAGLALAPWPMAPEPHLVEKIRMLFNGTLRKPIDIFDLVLHSAPVALVILKALKEFGTR